MAKVLFSRPKNDVTLHYLYLFSKELVSLSLSLNHETINKEKEQANKETIISLILKQRPKLIMFNGHGSSKEICGHKQEIIISSDDNPEVLKDTITYSLSCSSAAILGVEAVKNGAICFIGYKFDFALGKDPDCEASPRHDKIARLFLEPSNTLFALLLKGRKVEEALEKSKREMMDNLWYLNTAKDFPEAIYYAPFLLGNYLGLIARGNINSSI